MKRIETIKELRELLKEYREQGKSIGLVPTMGYLHEGHMSLIKAARKDNDVVVVSVFVNPTQFGVGEDYDSYPRDFDRDCELIKEAGGDIAFIPSVKEMYPDKDDIVVELEGDITKGLCGMTRPTHFRGVTIVVSKLFNIVNPDRAYFGQKDAQQVAVIKKMVRTLMFDIEIVACPIIRESNGLAMSSRNKYLTDKERQEAAILNQSLGMAEGLIESGERDASCVRSAMELMIGSVPSTDIDYIEIVDRDTLENIETIEGNVLIAMAVRFGKARLLDNIMLEV